MDENIKQLEEEISSLEIEVDALRDHLWKAEDELRELKPAKSEGESENTNNPDEEENPASIELTPEEKALMEDIANTQTELTVREMKLQALKKRLADAIANDSNYFKNEEEQDDAND